MTKAPLSASGNNPARGHTLLLRATHPTLWATVFASFVFARATSAFAAQTSPATKGGYNHDIRPILSDNCFSCHGPDKNQRKAKLRLDVREVAVETKAIIPGKPDESLLVKRIFSTDADDLMPPPETHKRLSPDQKEKLKRWIAAGAEYEPHWAYVKPARPAVPDTTSGKRVRNPIDGFILHGLEARSLLPSPESDRRTLLRRLSLDLLGLPPAPGKWRDFSRIRVQKPTNARSIGC